MYNNRCMKYPSNQHKPLYRGLEDDLPQKNWRFLVGMTMFDACNPLWNPYPGAAWRSSTSWFITSWELGLRGLRIKKSVETTNGLKPPTQFYENIFFSPLRGYILRFDVYESLYLLVITKSLRTGSHWSHGSHGPELARKDLCSELKNAEFPSRTPKSSEGTL
jgi:hypothetical protein